jgi:hypothetical protein
MSNGDLTGLNLDPSQDFSLGDSYYGLTDTGIGFTGSSTFQDVQLGSPLPLDTGVMGGPTAYGGPTSPSGLSVYLTGNANPNSSVTDLLMQDQSNPNQFLDSLIGASQSDTSQMLAGNSDVPPNADAASNSTNTPNSSPLSPLGQAVISAMGKFGAGMAQLFGAAPRTTTQIPNSPMNQAGTTTASLAAFGNGPLVLITVIVIAALALLVARSK